VQLIDDTAFYTGHDAFSMDPVQRADPSRSCSTMMPTSSAVRSIRARPPDLSGCCPKAGSGLPHAGSDLPPPSPLVENRDVEGPVPRRWHSHRRPRRRRKRQRRRPIPSRSGAARSEHVPLPREVGTDHERRKPRRTIEKRRSRTLATGVDHEKPAPNHRWHPGTRLRGDEAVGQAGGSVSPCASPRHSVPRPYGSNAMDLGSS
jgi:hypothetical protein